MCNQDICKAVICVMLAFVALLYSPQEARAQGFLGINITEFCIKHPQHCPNIDKSDDAALAFKIRGSKPKGYIITFNLYAICQNYLEGAKTKLVCNMIVDCIVNQGNCETIDCIKEIQAAASTEENGADFDSALIACRDLCNEAKKLSGTKVNICATADCLINYRKGRGVTQECCDALRSINNIPREVRAACYSALACFRRITGTNPLGGNMSMPSGSDIVAATPACCSAIRSAGYTDSNIGAACDFIYDCGPAILEAINGGDGITTPSEEKLKRCCSSVTNIPNAPKGAAKMCKNIIGCVSDTGFGEEFTVSRECCQLLDHIPNVPENAASACSNALQCFLTGTTDIDEGEVDPACCSMIHSIEGDTEDKISLAKACNGVLGCVKQWNDYKTVPPACCNILSALPDVDNKMVAACSNGMQCIENYHNTGRVSRACCSILGNIEGAPAGMAAACHDMLQCVYTGVDEDKFSPACCNMVGHTSDEGAKAAELCNTVLKCKEGIEKYKQTGENPPLACCNFATHLPGDKGESMEMANACVNILGCADEFRKGRPSQSCCNLINHLPNAGQEEAQLCNATLQCIYKGVDESERRRQEQLEFEQNLSDNEEMELGLDEDNEDAELGINWRLTSSCCNIINYLPDEPENMAQQCYNTFNCVEQSIDGGFPSSACCNLIKTPGNVPQNVVQACFNGLNCAKEFAQKGTINPSCCDIANYVEGVDPRIIAICKDRHRIMQCLKGVDISNLTLGNFDINCCFEAKEWGFDLGDVCYAFCVDLNNPDERCCDLVPSLRGLVRCQVYYEGQ